jgi:hypothetical protein
VLLAVLFGLMTYAHWRENRNGLHPGETIGDAIDPQLVGATR